LAGKNAGDVIRKYVDVLESILPELAAMKGFDQHNSYHKYDVLEHCIRAMEAVRTTPENHQYMKMAVLFHDMGKPDTYFMDDKGVGHFYGHPKKSEELARRVLGRLKADKAIVERIAVLVKYHDLLFDKDERLLKRWMNKLGADVLQEILEIKLADNIGTGNMSDELGRKFSDIRDMMADIIAQQQCFSLKDLAVKGDDLIAAGMKPGPEVGDMLQRMLDDVIDEECENEKEALMARLSIYRS
ncbi:MAG: HD domain-containing protein, partial [Firmicutes bacterium]|nr:HD domain-containing protein [Bacillota bacterium]